MITYICMDNIKSAIKIAKMKYTKTIFLLSLLFILSQGYAQPIITFENTTHDFGQIPEGIVATHEFKFTNEGDSPLILNKVQASCGCTTPYWTKEPILPGKEGVITASYNSKGRPGAFNRSITITSNASEPVIRLFIKGNAAPVNNAGEIYTKEELESSATINVEKTIINIGKVENGRGVPVKVRVKNTGKSNLIISGLQAACKCLHMSADSPTLIPPGKTEELSLVYRAKTTGKVAETVSIQTNDLMTPEAKVIIHAEVVESLSNTSILRERDSGFAF